MLIIYLWDTVFLFLIMVVDGCGDSDVVLEMFVLQSCHLKDVTRLTSEILKCIYIV